MPEGFRNQLYYGDCYDVLRKHIASESVDLVYLDPPFNSNRDYNVLFKEQTGAPAEAQVKAFTDTWKWSEDLYEEWDAFVDTCPNQPLVSLMQSFIQYLKRNDVTAYLARMTPRLYELHRVLKPTGSLYLHCDPAASHYLKILLDLIFGPMHYRNEVSWKRNFTKKGSQHKMRRYANNRDTILFYTKSDDYHFITPLVQRDQDDLTKMYDKVDDKGRRFKSEPIELPAMMARPNLVYEYRGYTPKHGWMMMRDKLEELDRNEKLYFTSGGKPRRKNFQEDYLGSEIDNNWGDIQPIGQNQSQGLGYPTQKPVALLKRILEASSNEGDVVLDPFCGCGTTIMAAQELKRNWIGMDITATATSLIEARLFDTFHIKAGKNGDYDVIGLPTTEAEAIELASRDKHEFQKWAISLVPRAMPWQEKKGADGGVDGFVRFRLPMSREVDLTIISVKGGQTLKMDDVKNLQATMAQNKAKLGFLISLVPPTRGIVEWAAKEPRVKSPDGGDPVPSIQCRTVAQLLRGEAFAFPWNSSISGIPKAGEGQAVLGI